MNCGMECIKYILFIFNFIFALGGLCLLGLAVSAYVGYTSEMQEVIGTDLTINGPLVTLMIAGAVIFIIAFFGCCGAIRESHCMIVTFAVCIMTLLAIQIGVSIWIFKIAGVDNAKESLGKAISTSMTNYKTNKQSEEFMNVIQTLAQCCGDTSSRDYTSRGLEIPYSCCGKSQGTTCNDSGNIYQKGCREGLPEAFNKYAKLIATSALVVAGVEVVGIIFSLCLASSISNAERRGYKV